VKSGVTNEAAVPTALVGNPANRIIDSLIVEDNGARMSVSVSL